MMDTMTFFRSLLFVCPAVCLLAQTPAPQPAAQGASSKEATPVAGAPKTPIPMPAAAPKPVVPPDRVVLKIGDVSLTAAQFEEIVSVLPAQMQAQARGPARKQFADQIVKMTLLAEQAKREKLDDSTSFKVQRKFSEDNLLANLAYKELSEQSKVTEADARKYYDEHKEEYEEVTARHILIRMKGSRVPLRPGTADLSDAEALAKAQDIRKKIAAGADFAKLAETESDDTGSSATGGKLPPFHKGQMVPSFEQAAFALKPGELSEPVKSDFGYHIIQVESHETKPFDTVRAAIEKQLQPEQTQKALEDMVKKADPVYDSEFFNLAEK
jgi:peptidyl-prolyl cis-trans isomerase C